MINLSKKIIGLPNLPGLYFFKNSKAEIIYIGKSVNLKNRVKSYFQRTSKLLPWTQKMVSEIKNVDIKVLNSEFEALLLEAKLINDTQPYYNIRSKDDKSFLMIAVSKEKYPRIFTPRNKETEAFYFGPYPSSNDIRLVLKTIRRIFKFRSCKNLPIRKAGLLNKPCLYYHINLCQGCCLSIDSRIYKAVIKKIVRLLNGDTKGLLIQLIKEMKKASKILDFETALELKRQIRSLNYITQNWQNLETSSLSLELNNDKDEQILKEAKQILSSLKELKRIECYDISNLYGNEATGSMVVFSPYYKGAGLAPLKDQYRKFKIRSIKAPDDVGMMHEVISRRLNHQEWELPNLIIVDGGKGQISAGFDCLRNKDLQDKISILGLAKSNEIIIKPVVVGKNIINYQEIKLKSNSQLLQLIQRLRDESHRFAKTYHVLLRKKKLLN